MRLGARMGESESRQPAVVGRRGPPTTHITVERASGCSGRGGRCGPAQRRAAVRASPNHHHTCSNARVSYRSSSAILAWTIVILWTTLASVMDTADSLALVSSTSRLSRSWRSVISMLGRIMDDSSSFTSRSMQPTSVFNSDSKHAVPETETRRRVVAYSSESPSLTQRATPTLSHTPSHRLGPSHAICLRLARWSGIERRTTPMRIMHRRTTSHHVV